MKKVYSAIICIACVILSALFCSCTTNTDPTDRDGKIASSSNEQTTIHTANPAAGSEEYTTHLPANTHRDSWNIELVLKEITDKYVLIHIVDNDNAGFWINTGYYELERLENGSWNKLTNADINNAYYALTIGWAVSKDPPYTIDLPTYNYLSESLLPLSAGHYRITKILFDDMSKPEESSRRFSLEFDFAG